MYPSIDRNCSDITGIVKAVLKTLATHERFPNLPDALENDVMSICVALSLSDPALVASGTPLFEAAPMSLLVRGVRTIGLAAGPWTVVGAVGALAEGSRAQRRVAYAAYKGLQQFPPAAVIYARALAPTTRLVRVIAYLATRFPREPNISTELLSRLPAEGRFATLIRSMLDGFVDVGSDEALSGWGAILLASRFNDTADFETADRLVSAQCKPPNKAYMRLSALQVRAAAAEGRGDLDASLRSLATAILILPDHVSTSSSLARIDELLRVARPTARRANLIGDVVMGEADYAIVDRAPWLSHAMLRELLFSDCLTAQEAAAFEAACPNAVPPHDCAIPAGTFKLTPPPALSGIVNEEDIAGRFVAGQASRRALWSVRAKNVRFAYHDGALAYFDADGQMLPLASTGHACFLTDHFLREKPVVEIDRFAVNLCLQYGRFNYSHFLLDRLPRLIHATGIDGGDVAIEPEMAAWTKECLDMMSIRANVLSIEPGKVYRFRDVLTFSTTQHSAQGAAPSYMQAFRSMVAGVEMDRRRRVFVHRDAGRRGLINESEVYAVLQRHGFEIIRLETLRIAEQARLFASAHVIGGLHGAGLSNIVFADSRATVLEIVPQHYFASSFYILASGKGCAYRALFGTAPELDPANVHPQFADSRVDPTSLDAMLSTLP